ncbi:hypothetical protein [Nostoc sp.]
MMAERPLDSDRQLLGHDIESDQLRHRSFSYFLSSLLRLRQRDAIRERLYFGRSLERDFHNINFLPLLRVIAFPFS